VYIPLGHSDLMYCFITPPPSRKFVISFQLYISNFLQEKAVEATKQKEEKRKKPKPAEE
jgi:hypothetical protein